MKRRKAKAERKEAQIRVAVTLEQKKKLTEAAAQSGQGVATWLRAVGLQEAAKLLDR